MKGFPSESGFVLGVMSVLALGLCQLQWEHCVIMVRLVPLLYIPSGGDPTSHSSWAFPMWQGTSYKECHQVFSGSSQESHYPPNVVSPHNCQVSIGCDGNNGRLLLAYPGPG